MLDANDILGPEGLIAKRLPNYEHRREQLEMAAAVEAAIDKGHHLAVEAGTGVGKSFAYLVPSILAVASREDVKRIVISTHTISLQEQLLFKDIPLLNSVIPLEFTAVLAKGRGNYISLRRLNNAQKRADSLFGNENAFDQLDWIRDWSTKSTDGSRSDLAFRPMPSVWEEVASDTHNCLGRKCPTYNKCFYYKARRRYQHAQLLLVNHALFFTDLALRRADVSVLPDYDAVIFDEAHTIEGVASQHMGIELSSSQIDFTLNRLYNDRNQRGLLVHLDEIEAQRAVDICRYAASDFFQQVYELHPNSAGSKRHHEPVELAQELGKNLRSLTQRLQAIAEKLDEEDPSAKDLGSACKRLSDMEAVWKCWVQQQQTESVYWSEIGYSQRQRMRISLNCAPLDVGESIRTQLLDKTRTVVLTSATLGVGQDDSFKFFRSRIGLTKAVTAKLGSPFDFERQVKLIVVTGLPDPSFDRDGFERVSTEMIQRYVLRSKGRAFVLFTSYSALRQAAEALTPWLTEQNMQLISQGDGLPRHQMLEQFKDNPESVLLGTDSFWQGVDIPGDGLTNVIIPKLPFSVPDHPLLEARLERIRQNGGNPFRDYQLPEAAIKLRQGFGRLIRSQSDSGMVVLLDPRIQTKSYGRLFIQSLPKCRLVEESVSEEVF